MSEMTELEILCAMPVCRCCRSFLVSGEGEWCVHCLERQREEVTAWNALSGQPVGCQKEGDR